MAIPATAVWEIRTAGNDTNGGGFIAGAAGSDYSQTDTKRTATGNDDSTTDAVANGTTTITSATANFGTTIVGNIIFFSGGTGAITACWRQVTARTNATTITIDAAIAASTGMTMNIGGALLSPALPGNTNASANAGATVWIKAGTYTSTTTGTNQIAGLFSKLSGTWYFRGYQTVRNDLGTPPTITVSGITNFTLYTNNSAGVIENIIFDGANTTGSRGLDLVAVMCYRVQSNNMKNTGWVATSGGCTFVECGSTGCNTAGSAFNVGGAGTRLMGCVAHTNTVHGFSLGQNCHVSRCIADSNTGTSDGFALANTNNFIENCVAYANGRDGFRIVSANNLLMNNIAEDNVAIGFNVTTILTPLLIIFNAAFSNATDYVYSTGIYVQTFSNISYSATAFVDAPNGDFALNAGQGATIAVNGWPGTFPYGTTIGVLAQGAAQPTGGSSGGGEHSSVF